jgi:hypothetical protein
MACSAVAKCNTAGAKCNVRTSAPEFLELLQTVKILVSVIASGAGRPH